MEVEGSKTKQLIRVAETLPYLPDLSFRITQFKKLRKQAKEFYKKEWRGKEKPSPAFNGRTVCATNYGWKHIAGKAFVTNYKDAIKRFNHLPNAKQILEKADFIYETIKEADKHGKIVNRHSLLGKLKNGLILRVVVKEVDGRLFFVTVYDPATIKKGQQRNTPAKSGE